MENQRLEELEERVRSLEDHIKRLKDGSKIYKFDTGRPPNLECLSRSRNGGTFFKASKSTLGRSRCLYC